MAPRKDKPWRVSLSRHQFNPRLMMTTVMTTVMTIGEYLWGYKH